MNDPAAPAAVYPNAADLAAAEDHLMAPPAPLQTLNFTSD